MRACGLWLIFNIKHSLFTRIKVNVIWNCSRKVLSPCKRTIKAVDLIITNYARKSKDVARNIQGCTQSGSSGSDNNSDDDEFEGTSTDIVCDDSPLRLGTPKLRFYCS